MVKHRLSRKNKGETLVEVIVAFGILSIVIMGVASLTADIMSLAINSRNQTEAVMLAQRNLALAKNSLQTRCRISDTAAIFSDGHIIDEFNSTNDSANYLVSIDRKGLVYLDTLSTLEENDTLGLNESAGYYKLVSEISWANRGDTTNRIYYRISEIIRR